MNVKAASGLFLLLLLAATARAAPALEIQISGLQGELLDNARAALATDRQERLSEPEIRALHEAAPGRIARALEPFGYYRPEIHAALEPPAAGGGPWRASYRVEAGPPLPVVALAVTFTGGGEDDPALEPLVSQLPVSEGEPLDHRHYETARRELLQQVQSAGYRDAGYAVHRVEVDLEQYTARVVLDVATGPRYILGPISFEQTRFDDSYLQRYLVLRPGDPYDGRLLSEQRRELSRSGHFSEVEIESLPPDPADPHAIPLRIRLATFLPNRYRGRLGWGTDTGVGAQLDWTRRYVGGRGQHFNLGLALVEERRKLAGDLNYVIPLDPLARSRVTIGARHESKDLTFEDVELPRGGETRIATNLLSASWSRPLTFWGNFQVTPEAELSLVSESYDVFEVLFGHFPASDQQDLIDIIGQAAYDTLTPDFEALVPAFRLSLRRSDDTLFIHNGDFVDLQLLGASEALGSNIDFWQARLDTWNIRSFGERSRLLLRTEMGYSEAESREVLGVNFNELPEYYEFRAGGVRSVRGYGFEELVPADAITGGKHELVASVEYEYEVIPNWSIAAFVDGGNAFNRWGDYEPKVGVGIGARFRSPVGQARLDIGFPLDDSEDAFQIYITVGPEF